MIDVSSYQNEAGPVDWQMIFDAGIRRAGIKLGEDPNRATGYPGGIDPYAIVNIHHARAVGITIMLYWFAHPGYSTAAESSARFLDLAHGHLLPGDLPPALDLEVTEGRSLSYLSSWKGDFFGHVDPVINTRAVIYLDLWFYNSPIGQSLYPDRPVWIAHPATLDTATRDRAFCWQYGQGRVPGIKGPVDLDEILHPDRPVPAIPPPAV